MFFRIVSIEETYLFKSNGGRTMWSSGHGVWLRSDADALGTAFQAEQTLGTAGNQTSKRVQSFAESRVGNIAYID